MGRPLLYCGPPPGAPRQASLCDAAPCVERASPRGRLTPVSPLLPVCSWEIIDPGRASQSGPAPPPGDALRLLLQETSAFRQQNPGKVNVVGGRSLLRAPLTWVPSAPPSSACWSAACARSWPCWDATFPGWFCRTCWVRRRPSSGVRELWWWCACPQQLLPSCLSSSGRLPLAARLPSRPQFVAQTGSAETGLWSRRVPPEDQREPW